MERILQVAAILPSNLPSRWPQCVRLTLYGEK